MWVCASLQRTSTYLCQNAPFVKGVVSSVMNSLKKLCFSLSGLTTCPFFRQFSRMRFWVRYRGAKKKTFPVTTWSWKSTPSSECSLRDAVPYAEQLSLTVDLERRGETM